MAQRRDELVDPSPDLGISCLETETTIAIEDGVADAVQGPTVEVFFQKARLRPLMPSFRINPIASWRSFAPSRCA